jgi:hypothetical protein
MFVQTGVTSTIKLKDNSIRTLIRYNNGVDTVEIDTRLIPLIEPNKFQRFLKESA